MSASARHLVYLVHWNEAEVLAYSAVIASRTLRMQPCWTASPEVIKEIRRMQPAAVVISLDRLPSHGKELARVLQLGKQTRMIPLVFAGGPPEKVDPMRALFTDATFVDWQHARKQLAEVVRKGPLSISAPPKPAQAQLLAGGGTPLVQKLGCKTGMRIGCWREPEEFRELLGDLPDGAEFFENPRAAVDMHLWFVRSLDEFERELEFMITRSLPKLALWVIYPKQAAKVNSNLTQPYVRKRCLEEGLVDNKICSVSATWTAMRFVPKKENKSYKA